MSEIKVTATYPKATPESVTITVPYDLAVAVKRLIGMGTLDLSRHGLSETNVGPSGLTPAAALKKVQEANLYWELNKVV